MDIEQKIDSSILKLYQLMPSAGEWPFTILRVDRIQITGLPFETSPVSESLVLVLKRTNFDREDISDYAQNLKEYGTIPDAYKGVFVDNFVNKFNNNSEIDQWSDNITSMGIGLIMQMARLDGLELRAVQTVLSRLDFHMELEAKSLKPYELFEVIGNNEA